MKQFHLEEVCEAEKPIQSENGEDGLHACRVCKSLLDLCQHSAQGLSILKTNEYIL